MFRLSRRIFSSSSQEAKVVTFTMKSINWRWEVKGEVGANLMRTGIEAGVPFFEACGGNAECCTCHVKLPATLLNAEDIPKPEENE